MEKGFSAILIIIVIVILGLTGVGSFYFFNQQKIVSINSFDDCAKKYPVMESFPEQCNTPDGKHFVQELKGGNQKEGELSQKEIVATTSAEIDGVVWNDVHQLVVLVNLFYFKNQRLPVSIDEILADPEYSYYQLKNDPINGQPYRYVIGQNEKSFEVSGMQSDGVLYKQEISID